MKESIEGSAILDDVDEGTFIGFCGFAYRGAYATPDRRGEDNDGEYGSFDGSQKEQHDRVPQPEPEEMPAQEWGLREREPSPVHIDNCDMYKTKREWISFNKKVAYGIPLSKVKTHATYVQYPYDGLWKQFRQLHFVGDEASISLVPDLVFHGKLYVFANQYLVDSLRTQCLKSLHRDLCEFSLNKQNVPHILDLLEYTYQESGRGDPGIGCSLKDLVIHYAACEARTAGREPPFWEYSG